jgi:hypothetical protein
LEGRDYAVLEDVPVYAGLRERRVKGEGEEEVGESSHDGLGLLLLLVGMAGGELGSAEQGKIP